MRKDVVVLLCLMVWIVTLAGGIYLSLVGTARHPIAVMSDFSARQRVAPASSR